MILRTINYYWVFENPVSNLVSITEHSDTSFMVSSVAESNYR